MLYIRVMTQYVPEGHYLVVRRLLSGAQAPGGPPAVKKMQYMRECMPENQVETKCVKTPPESRKGVYQVSGCHRMSWRRNELF